MKHVAWLLGVFALLALVSWLVHAEREPHAAVARASARQRTTLAAARHQAAILPAAPRARRLLATDRELLEPELSIQSGPLEPEPGQESPSYGLRLEKRTLALGEPLEAQLFVRDASGAAQPFRTIGKDIVRRDSGDSEPGGSWSEQATAEGTHFSWVPGDLPAPTGPRELVITIELAGRQQAVSAQFEIAAGSPLMLTGKVSERRRTGVLEIDVEVESKAALACELSANLFDRAGTPLQHTSYSGVVGPGLAHVLFEFSQDIQADTRTLTAPIVVRHLRGTCRRADDPQGTELPVAFVDEVYRTL